MVTVNFRRSNSEFIPRNAAQFAQWVSNISAYITPARATEWGIPATVLADFRGIELENFLNAQEEIGNDPTRSKLAARNAAQREATRIIRFIIRFYLRRPEVADSDLIAMGIPPIDTIRTMHKVVTEKVDFVIQISGIRRIVVDFWQQGVEHSKAKPRGYDGAVLIWNISDERPPEADDFLMHTMASRRPFTVEFLDEDRGKTVWIALAWQNERGIRGEWSEFKSAVIP